MASSDNTRSLIQEILSRFNDHDPAQTAAKQTEATKEARTIR